jgi:hypothetical protein
MQQQSSRLWLLMIRWSWTSSTKSIGSIPTVGKAITQGIAFIASGRRQETDHYLFLNRLDAQLFETRIEEKLKTRRLLKWKGRVEIVEVTPEDVAHLDLDPAPRKTKKQL